MKDSIDLSPFGWRDVADIALQRTQHLLKLPGGVSPSFKRWGQHKPFALYAEAILRRGAILRGALNDTAREFETISGFLAGRTIGRIVDIGCGHALIDALFYKKYRCDIHLIDIEHTSDRYHGYNERGSGYGSLASSLAYLTANGVPASAVVTTNPNVRSPQDQDCDLIFSLYSCGFHYPAQTYAAFVDSALRPGGLFLFDLRKGTEQLRLSRRVVKTWVVEETPRHVRRMIEVE